MRTAVLIGRFQPLHKAHQRNIEETLFHYDTLVVVLGSHLAEPSLKNPWSSSEREAMIRYSTPLDLAHKLKIVRVHDHPGNNDAWVKEVTTVVDQAAPNSEYPIYLTGCDKDESTFYLSLFPLWEKDFFGFTPLDGSKIRKLYFGGEPVEKWGRFVPENVKNFMLEFQNTESYWYLARQYNGEVK